MELVKLIGLGLAVAIGVVAIVVVLIGSVGWWLDKTRTLDYLSTLDNDKGIHLKSYNPESKFLREEAITLLNEYAAILDTDVHHKLKFSVVVWATYFDKRTGTAYGNFWFVPKFVYNKIVLKKTYGLLLGSIRVNGLNAITVTDYGVYDPIKETWLN